MDLSKASRKGDVEEVERILSEEGYPTFEGPYGPTPLTSAVRSGHTEVVKLLLNSNIDIKNEKSALQYAADGDYAEIVQLLLDAGINVNVKNRWGETALITVTKDSPEIVTILLDHDANVNDKTLSEKTALMIFSKWSVVNTEILLRDGINVNVNDKDAQGFTALIWATLSGLAKNVEMLLDAGAFVDDEDNFGYTALAWASRKGFTEIVKLLLDAGANPHGKDEFGFTSLIYASKDGYGEIVQMLLDEDVNVNTTDSYSDENLIHPSKNTRYGKRIKMFVFAGKNQYGEYGDGDTALIHASEWKHEEIVKTLLKYGANPNIENNYGYKALYYASQPDNEGIVELLTFYIDIYNSKPVSVKEKPRSDITFTTYETDEHIDRVKVEANKENLGESSDYFYSLFNRNWKDSNKLIYEVDSTKEWNYKEAFEAIVDFMETGWIGNITPQVALDILPAATYYNLNEVFEKQVALKLIENFKDEGVKEYIESIDGLSSIWDTLL